MPHIKLTNTVFCPLMKVNLTYLNGREGRACFDTTRRITRVATPDLVNQNNSCLPGGWSVSVGRSRNVAKPVLTYL